MKKQYTKIKGIRIAYKGSMNWYDRHVVLGMIYGGIISNVLPDGGWWIIAKLDN
jgi:hypothetical protein